MTKNRESSILKIAFKEVRMRKESVESFWSIPPGQEDPRDKILPMIQAARRARQVENGVDTPKNRDPREQPFA
ncbi:MAG: hypothetical protein COV59_00540 [Candidatus Magasanikbacteria bacterium CG11_big_fil_rev_8_21_14_0_20_39_34]|uniref:Uncharacterized protein n=1 Tax=Candidatus Magasanikbacteria bacterium CG11_big_fil_rev_8_21_14_0_20_39_34 TaxID=1974653 RepID=A0A2H0N8I7_9BACT|nr:MAG: hypothetical protein COV59_00540 [Candidatus Magasanikbacteria bacterium CG11_big_fil_rev_8_21_14_0_20_39_34]